MKRPFLNMNERQSMISETTAGIVMRMGLALRKLKRQIWRDSKWAYIKMFILNI